MKRVLILSYYFPPDGGPGTQRALKFCKYLPAFGWSPIIVTRTSQRERTRWETEDRSLEREIDPTANILRVEPSADVPAWVEALPAIDISRQWMGPAWDVVEEAVERHRPDVLVITMSPFDLAHVGKRVVQELGIPVVLDLRDPWALDGWRVGRTRADWERDFDAMRETLASATLVIANTPEARLAILDNIDGVDAERVGVVPNGYDAEDFADLDLRRVPRDPDRFRLVHTGTLHCASWQKLRGPIGFLRRLRQYRVEPVDPEGRTIVPLMRALGVLSGRGHPIADKLKIVLAGNTDDATRGIIEKSGFAKNVEFSGYLSHGESVSLLIGADALFLPLHALPPGHRSRIVPGKTYEYLAAGRPILGCLPEGDARDLVARSGLGYLADPKDPVSIASALVKLYDDWSEDKFDDTRPADWVSDYERRRLTGRLAGLLDRITG